MRKIFLLLTLIFVLYIVSSPFHGRISSFVRKSPCQITTTFKIKDIDSRFKTSEAVLLNDIEKATAIWEESSGYNLFEYDPAGVLSISMIFDERQSLSNDIGKLEGDLSKKGVGLGEEIEEFKRLSESLKARINEFNNRVDYWNERGGAPPDEFESLLAEQKALNDEADRLNALAKKLNQDTQNYNASITDLNRTIGTFNETLLRKPEEGRYLPETNEIEVYFVVSKEELIHTIAHEFGHALGLSHVGSPEAIMYEFSSTSLRPVEEEINALEQICSKNIWVEKIKSLF